MDAAALEARFRHLEQKNAELEREIQLLRTAVHEPKEDAREGALLPRRDLLKGAAYTLGAVSLSLMSPRHAEADIGTMIYGTLNDAGGGATELRCRSFSTLRIINSREHDDDPLNGNALYALSVSGHAIRAQVPGVDSVGAGLKVDVEGSGSGVNVVKNGHNGYGVLALHNSPTSISGAIVGVTAGAGPGVYGRGGGSGVGVWGQLIDSAQKQSAVLGTTEGTGAAIEANQFWDEAASSKEKRRKLDFSRPVRQRSLRPDLAEICSWIPPGVFGTARPGARPRGGSSSRSERESQLSALRIGDQGRRGDSPASSISARTRQIFASPDRAGRARAQRMDKLQRAGRDFLMRLVAKHGPQGSARVLRALADELAALECAPRIKRIAESAQRNPACQHALKDF